MLSDILEDISLFRILYQIDLDLASACRQAGCPFCRSPLHRASYERKPQGGPDKIPIEYSIRQSLCCSHEACRRRVLPPSCLFFGRKVNWGPVVLIVVTMWQQNPRGHSINMLARKFKISRNTVVRWIQYFRDVFPKSLQWQRLRGLVSGEIRSENLPCGLVEIFLNQRSCLASGLVKCLQFFASGHAT